MVEMNSKTAFEAAAVAAAALFLLVACVESKVPDDSRDMPCHAMPCPLPPSSPADEYLIRRVSAARHGAVRLQDYAAAVFMRDGAAICEIPRIEDERTSVRPREIMRTVRVCGRSS